MKIKAMHLTISPHYHGHPQQMFVRMEIDIDGEKPMFIQRELSHNDFESHFTYMLREIKKEVLRFVRTNEENMDGI